MCTAIALLDFMRLLLSISKSLILLAAVGLLSQDAFALTILYPGSFDPFHLTHQAEANGLLSENPGAHLVILPIEKAYYNRVHGIDQPSFIPYDLRVKLLKDEFAAQPDIQVETRLRVIERNPVDLLIEILSSLQDPDRKILIGTDVLEKWQNNPSLPALLKVAKLVVSRDPRQTAQHKDFEKLFAGNDRVSFVDLPVSGVRSVDLIRDLFSDSPEAFERAQAQLPAALASGFAGPARFHLRDRYRQQLNQYLRSLAQIELRPLIAAARGNLSADAFRFLQTTPENLYLLMMLLPAREHDSAETKAIAEGALNALKSEGFASYFGKERQPFIIEELRRFVAATSFTKTALAQGLEFGREYIYPRYELWGWKGIDAPELAGEAEVRSEGIGKSLWTKEAGQWIPRGRLQVLKAQAPLYHWNTEAYAKGWAEAGTVSPAEVLWRDLFMDGMAGGGFYVSQSPRDSNAYGPVQTAFFAKQDSLALTFNRNANAFESDKQVTFLKNPFSHMLLRAAGVAAAQTKTTASWFTILQPSALDLALPGLGSPSLMCRQLFARPSHP